MSHIPVYLVLVEDSPDETAMIIRELQREFVTLQVEQPRDFNQLERVLAGGNAELIITEYQLQWTTGMTVLEKVKKLQPNCPVIMFTRNGSEQIAVAAMKAGLDDYIVKAPENYTSLTAAVRQMLLKARQQKLLTHFVVTQPNVREQKLVNDKLHQQAQLLDLANDAIIVTEPDGAISYWNQGAQRLYGFSVEEAVGNNSDSLLKTEFPQPLTEIKTQLTEHGYWSGEPVHSKRDGTKIIVSSHWTLQQDNQGNSLAILEINRNLSEIKQAQKTQRQIQAQLKRLFESNLIGIIFANFSGSITEANDAFLEIVGYTREDLLAGRVRWKEMTPPEYHQVDALSRAQLSSTGVSTPFEKEYIRKDGTRVPVLLGAALLEGSEGDCVCFALDLSERKHLEAALLNSIKRLQNLHTIDVAILAAKSPQETAGAALETLRQLLPCPRLSVVVFDFEAQQGELLAVHSDNKNTPIKVGTNIDLEPFTDLLEQLRQGEICGLQQLETLPILLPVVQAFLAEGLSSFLSIPMMAQQELIGALNLWIDPTSPLKEEQISIAQEVADQLAIAIKQSQLQQQLISYTNQLEKRVAVRTKELQAINAELEAFSYSVSHDLRAPLRAMQGFGNALLEDCQEQLGELGLEYTERIITAAQRLDRMIQDLLAYSRLGRTEIQLRPISLESVVKEVLEQLEIELKDTKAQITLGAKGLVPLPAILGHRATLIQVLLNLITNAIKFVTPSVQPQVQIWAEERAAPNDRVCIRLWVEDNGIGIKPEYQERIFKVFERLHGRESYSGSGIGLAIVRKGMERLGGDSGVESSIAQGSRFWVEAEKATRG
ncbi:PAS domain S-box protein [Lyngbya aestuarii]|uniref:PAS domain S-box protein n=1 Tax=Lyngbya aestuarii TaxID=118322 RepID=UPI00403DDBDE